MASMPRMYEITLEITIGIVMPLFVFSKYGRKQIIGSLLSPVLNTDDTTLGQSYVCGNTGTS